MNHKKSVMDWVIVGIFSIVLAAVAIAVLSL